MGSVEPSHQLKIGDHGERVDGAALKRVKVQRRNPARINGLAQIGRAAFSTGACLHKAHKHLTASRWVALGIECKRPPTLRCCRNLCHGLTENGDLFLIGRAALLKIADILFLRRHKLRACALTFSAQAFDLTLGFIQPGIGKPLSGALRCAR